MIQFAVKAPTVPIPFHPLFKVVALVDGQDPRTRELLDHIAAQHFEIEVCDNFDRDVSEDAGVGAYIALIDGDRRERARALARAVRALGHQIPLWALADSSRIADVAVLGMTGEVDGHIYLGHQSPAFYAKQVVASIATYEMNLLPPLFGGPIAFDKAADIAFDSPGHQRSRFHRTLPAGQIFFKHFGERVFRNDPGNGDVDPGDLPIHDGAAGRARQHAAHVSVADQTYLVLNGASTANKVVTNAVLCRGDLVLFDRNNHQSLHQGALIQAGAIPVFLPTARNPFGLIGAADWDAWSEDRLREQIRTHPLVKDPDLYKAPRPFRLACLQLATNDGTVYNVRKVLERIGHLCDYVLWDEAGIGSNAVHPLFDDHSPMRLGDLTPEMPGLFSTQPVHTPGAAFSQASHIHKRDDHLRGQRRYVEHKRFNESFLMNASTSPLDPLLASLDVNAPIHEGRAGEAQWDRCIGLGVEARKTLRQFVRHYESTGLGPQEQWFFDPFVPDIVSIRGSRFTDDVTDVRWENLPTGIIKAEPQCWTFDPAGARHGYRGYADGYTLVDPNKLTLLTPGIDLRTGEYLAFGVPAPVVAHFLREQRVVPEKCDLHSILFLMTPAEDESTLNTLIAKLTQFKDLWDRDAPLAAVLPTLCASHGARYAGYTLRRICHEMHAFYRCANVRERQRSRATGFPEPAMSQQDVR
jgi:ornithine decarboxylase